MAEQLAGFVLRLVSCFQRPILDSCNRLWCWGMHGGSWTSPGSRMLTHKASTAKEQGQRQRLLPGLQGQMPNAHYYPQKSNFAYLVSWKSVGLPSILFIVLCLASTIGLWQGILSEERSERKTAVNVAQQASHSLEELARAMFGTAVSVGTTVKTHIRAWADISRFYNELALDLQTQVGVLHRSCCSGPQWQMQMRMLQMQGRLLA